MPVGVTLAERVEGSREAVAVVGSAISWSVGGVDSCVKGYRGVGGVGGK